MKNFSLTQRFLVGRASLFLVIFLAGCATLGEYNPATERREFIMIPTDSEVSMGKSIHQEILQEFSLSKNMLQTQRVQAIGQRLSRVSDRQDYAYHFYLVEKDDINAFTTPGGNIYFFTGLLDKLKTDDQIAAVLGHEIGHCAAKHTIKKFQAAMGYNLIGSIIFSQISSEAARSTASLAANTAMQLATSAYGRQDEYQADLLGLKYMSLAGYSLNGMIETLQVLEKESHGAKPPLILSTHPYAEDRIKVVKEEIPRVEAKHKK